MTDMLSKTPMNLPAFRFSLSFSIIILFSYFLALAGPYVTQDSSWKISVLNILPILLFSVSIYLLSFRLVFTIILISATTLSLYYVHTRKLEELSLPLVYNDILMIPQFFKSPEFIWNFGTWPVFVGFPLLLLLLFFSLYWERSFVKRHIRIIAAALSLLPVASLAVSWSPLTGAYKTLKHTPWHYLEAISDTGMMASLVRQSLDAYKQLGFKNGKNSRTQTTDYLFISNFISKNQKRKLNLAAWQLSTALLDTSELTGNSQFSSYKSLYDQLDQWHHPNPSCETDQCKVLKAVQLEQLSGIPTLGRNSSGDTELSPQ